MAIKVLFVGSTNNDVDNGNDKTLRILSMASSSRQLHSGKEVFHVPPITLEEEGVFVDSFEHESRT